MKKQDAIARAAEAIKNDGAEKEALGDELFNEICDLADAAGMKPHDLYKAADKAMKESVSETNDRPCGLHGVDCPSAIPCTP